MEKEQALLMLGLLLAMHAHGQQQHQCHPPRQSSLTVQHQPQQQAPQYEEHPYHCESGDQHMAVLHAISLAYRMSAKNSFEQSYPWLGEDIY